MKSVSLIQENLSEEWKIVKFKDIFEIRKGKKVNISENPTENSVPYVVIENLRGEPIKNFTDDGKGLLCCPDDILIVWDGANCGTVGSGLNGFVGSTIARLSLIDDSINKDYVLIFLKSRFKLFNTYTTGATIPHLDKNFLINFIIPVPSLETQKKIVEILEKSEKLKKWRTEADELADELLKSVFLDMFGDPVKNEKKWNLANLSELGAWKSGGTPSRKNKEFFIGDISWYTSGELNSMYISDSIEQITKKAIDNSNAKLIEPNSLLLGMYDTAALKSSITTIPSSCNQAIAYSKLEYGKANIIYVYFAIQIGRKFFMSRQRGIRQKNLNLTMIKETEIPLPPIELQNQFAGIIKQVETLKSHQKQSKEEIDNLFNVLMQKAFKGELAC